MTAETGRRILCDGKYHGDDCNKWLATSDGLFIRVQCRRCKSYHEEPVVNLLADLSNVIDELRAAIEEVDEMLSDRGVTAREMLEIVRGMSTSHSSDAGYGSVFGRAPGPD